MRLRGLASLLALNSLITAVSSYGTTVQVFPATCRALPASSQTAEDSIPPAQYRLSVVPQPGNIVARQVARQYVLDDGTVTEDCDAAALYYIDNGKLSLPDGRSVSTNRGRSYSPLAASSMLFDISTTFSVVNESLLAWTNDAFEAGKAKFCLLGTTVQAVFVDQLPTDCLQISVGYALAVDCSSSNQSTSMQTTLSGGSATMTSATGVNSTRPTSSAASTTIASDSVTTDGSTIFDSSIISGDSMTPDLPMSTIGPVSNSSVTSTSNGASSMLSSLPSLEPTSSSTGTSGASSSTPTELPISSNTSTPASSMSSFMPPSSALPTTSMSSSSASIGSTISQALTSESSVSISAPSDSVTSESPSLSSVSSDFTASESSISASATSESTAAESVASETTISETTTPGSTTVESSISASATSATSETMISETTTSEPISSGVVSSTSSSSISMSTTSPSPVPVATDPATPLCPDYDNQVVRIGSNSYQVFCSTDLEGEMMTSESSRVGTQSECARFCNLYNSAIPYGCIGTTFDEASSSGNNCFLWGRITGQTQSVERNAMRLIYPGNPQPMNQGSGTAESTTTAASSPSPSPSQERICPASNGQIKSFTSSYGDSSYEIYCSTTYLNSSSTDSTSSGDASSSSSSSSSLDPVTATSLRDCIDHCTFLNLFSSEDSSASSGSESGDPRCAGVTYQNPTEGRAGENCFPLDEETVARGGEQISPSGSETDTGAGENAGPDSAIVAVA